jgi:hypothetical protein
LTAFHRASTVSPCPALAVEAEHRRDAARIERSAGDPGSSPFIGPHRGHQRPFAPRTMRIKLRFLCASGPLEALDRLLRRKRRRRLSIVRPLE